MSLEQVRRWQDILHRHARTQLDCTDAVCFAQGGRLILKLGRGNFFYGCNRFPLCRRTLPADQHTGDVIRPTMRYTNISVDRRWNPDETDMRRMQAEAEANEQQQQEQRRQQQRLLRQAYEQQRQNIENLQQLLPPEEEDLDPARQNVRKRLLELASEELRGGKAKPPKRKSAPLWPVEPTGKRRIILEE